MKQIRNQISADHNAISSRAIVTPAGAVVGAARTGIGAEHAGKGAAHAISVGGPLVSGRGLVILCQRAATLPADAIPRAVLLAA